MSHMPGHESTSSFADALVAALESTAPDLDDDQRMALRDALLNELRRYPDLDLVPSALVQEAAQPALPIVQIMLADHSASISHAAQYAVHVVALQVTEDPRCAVPARFQNEQDCPYPGLAAFGESQASLYFGRASEIQALIPKIVSTSTEPSTAILAIAGPSGVGKSSFIAAGVLPALRHQYYDPLMIITWRVGATGALLTALDEQLKAYTVSGFDHALAVHQSRSLLLAAIDHAEATKQRLIVVMDQFEALFVGDDLQRQTERKQLLDDLVLVANATFYMTTILLVTRENYLEHPDYLARPQLRTIIQQPFRLEPLLPSQLHQIIERPLHAFQSIHQQQIQFQPGLVEAVVAQVKPADSAALALIQYLMRLLWLDQGYLSFVAFHRLGGLGAVLDQHANALYYQFRDDERLVVQYMLLTLVRPGIGDEAVRKRVRVEDLMPAGATVAVRRTVEQALRLLTDERSRILSEVTVAGVTQVELTHEILLRQWSVLRNLIEVQRQQLILRERLLATAEMWIATRSKQQPLGAYGYRYYGALLDDARHYVAAVPSEMGIDQRIQDCYTASLEWRKRFWWRAIVSTLISFALLTILIFTLRQETGVVSQINESQRLAIAAQQHLQEPELALLLAYEAGARNMNIASEQALRDALLATAWQPTTLYKGLTEIHSIEFSPDGRDILVTSETNTALLIGQDQQIHATFQHDQAARMTGASFSHNGRLILTTATDGARLWDRSGVLQQNIQANTAITRAVFRPDDQEILTVLLMRGALQLQGLDGVILATFTLPGAQVLDAAYSPDGTLIGMAGTNGVIQIRERDGSVRTIFPQQNGNITSIVFHPDGKRLLTAGQDGSARIWQIDGQLITTLTGHASGILQAAFSSDGQQIVTTGADGTTRVWSIDGQQVALLRNGSIPMSSAAISPDMRAIITAGNDGSLRIWHEIGAPLPILRGHTDTIWSVAINPNNTRILSASQDGTARLWDTTGTLLTTLTGHGAALDHALFSPDGSRILTTSRDGTARLWDDAGHPLALLSGHTGEIWSAAFSPDGQYVVTGSSDTTARLWNLHGQELAVLSGHGNWVMSVAFSPNGEYIATGSPDADVRLWDRMGHSLAILRGHTGDIETVVFRPTGDQILTASADGSARLWDLQGKELRILSGHTDWVTSAAFSPNSMLIVTTSNDRTARLWNADGTLHAILNGHNGPVLWAVFDPSSQYVLTGSRDGTARLWRTTDGLLQTILPGHTGSVTSGSFSTDGRLIATASADGTIRLHLRFAQDLLIAAACRVTRDLSADEQVQFALPQPLLNLHQRNCTTSMTPPP